MTQRAGVPVGDGLHPLAVAVAVALHLAAGVGLLHWQRPLLPPADPYSIDVQLDPVAPPEPEVAQPAPAPEVQPDPPPEPPPEPDVATLAEEVPPPLPQPPLEVLMAMLPTPDPPEPVEIAPLDLPRPPVPPPPEKPRASPRPRPVQAVAPVATAAATEASAPAAPAPVATITPDWQGRLSAWLMSHRYYPEAARRRGEHGTVIVRFTVVADGTVTTVSLVKGAGSTILDEAALGMLRGARVPPFPSSMAQAAVTVAVPIRYALEH